MSPRMKRRIVSEPPVYRWQRNCQSGQRHDIELPALRPSTILLKLYVAVGFGAEVGDGTDRPFMPASLHVFTHRSMQLIPVIDIRNGIAVRAVAGERQRYQPLESCWTSSTEPATILKSLLEHFNVPRCYVADLDAIESRDRSQRTQNRCTISELTRCGCEILLDAGATSGSEIADWLDLGVTQVVVASESLPDVSLLPSLIGEHGAGQLVFSLDLKQGRLLSPIVVLHDGDPLSLVRESWDAGFRQLIVLDLAAVGVGSGLVTLDLCRQIRRAFPEMAIVTGGGVRSQADIDTAAAAGIDGLLVASALHDGRLSPVI